MKALSVREPWTSAIVLPPEHVGLDTDNRNRGVYAGRVVEAKTIENRVWTTKFRGRFLLHASGTMTRMDYHDAAQFIILHGGFACPRKHLQLGGVVGVATLVDVLPPRRTPYPQEGSLGWREFQRLHPLVTYAETRWHIIGLGQYGFVLRDIERLPFLPFKGLQRWFDVPYDGAR